MKYLSFIVFFIIASAPWAVAQRIVINEVMYAPIKPEPEWIELFNPSDSAASIAGWKISDLVKTYPLPFSVIPAHEYLVLTKDSAALVNKYPLAGLHIVKMTMPSLNNTGDLILIKDSLGFVIDSLRFYPTWGGADGRSLERVDSDSPADSSNFGSCTSADSATPGAPNSIRRRDYDLALESITVTVIGQTDLSLMTTVRNKGRKEIADGIVKLISNSGLPLTQSQITSPIAPLEKQDVELTWQNADYGRSPIRTIVTSSQDEMLTNDTLRSEVYIPIPRNAIIINEIMASPQSSSSQWIELYNNSSNIANLDSSLLLVSGTDTIYKFRIDSLPMLPKHYAVIDASTKFFSTFPSLKGRGGIAVLGKSDLKLADTGSEIILVNSDGSIIDSLHYYSSWHSANITGHTGISLERKISSSSGTDGQNWSSSLDPRGCTPLEKNSYSSDTLLSSSTLDVEISPNPFSPDGDGFNDVANITIALPSESEEVISAKLYDLRGRLRSTVAQNQRVFRTESIRFEGKDDNGLTLPIGLYILVVESSSGLFKPQRKGIVIMKKAR